ncbi:MAG TPA: excalibur calcium-binding domain-containing protein [Roseiflexaceae bacterium]|nr:excalibur calcium-binding domain-containing protein [Roseiflexaceae bacterium]
MNTHRTRFIGTTLVLVVMLAVLEISTARAASYPANLNWAHYFQGSCTTSEGDVCEAVLGWLERNGGLPVFGLPIGQAYLRESDGAVIMPFERFRVEFRDDIPAPYNFQLGLMGEERLIQQGYIWQNMPKEQPQPGCRFYPETGYNLCGDFLRYWDTHGREFGHRGVSYEESLALFGYPITPARIEPGSDGVPRLTQWFQRARMELHNGIGVLQGLLAVETIRAGSGDTTVPFLPEGQTYTPPSAPSSPPQRRFPSRRMTCSEFATWEEAQAALAEGHTELDRDGDGEACESLR